MRSRPAPANAPPGDPAPANARPDGPGRPVSGPHPCAVPGAPGPLRTLVVIGATEEGLGRWGTLAAALGRALNLDLAPEPAPGPPAGPARTEAVLDRAAGVAGPVLVLPASSPTFADEVEPALERVLAPFDTSDAVAARTGPVLARLRDCGVAIVQLHVVSRGTMPAMWEGSGHHAEAWHAELRRRHQVEGADVEVAVGDLPPGVVASRAAGVDLVILFWKRQPAAGRAEVVRRVLSSTEIPALLVPLR